MLTIATRQAADAQFSPAISELDPSSQAERIPADIRASLTPSQIERLTHHLKPPHASHAMDYRVTTTLFGQRIYLALFTGTDLRQPDRLAKDKQHRSVIELLLKLTLACFSVCVTVTFLALTCIVMLYLVKSALGINLFGEPSFLHRYFFD